ncbi:hypothetical protein N431DRAFT_349755 [Stipitochalara longipes BDJ]|nr:hypothetical protein N431DRAFT_349755 [Stipitochalara longipes BDJ]
MDEPRSPTNEDEPGPYNVKELFIEYCVREWRPEYFSEVIGKNNLETMSMLNSFALKDLEPGAALYSGPDLFASLHREVSSAGRETWLQNYIHSCLQDEQFRNQVGVRLDEDLNAVGMSKLTGTKTSMKEKARALAKSRLKRNISWVEQPDPPKTFMVMLKTLIGGYAGLPQKTLLYFNYGTKFEVFLIMLRDATQRSTIPPIDIDEQSAARREHSTDIAPDNASQISTSQHGRQPSGNGRESGQGSEGSYGTHSLSYTSSSRDASKPQHKLCSSHNRGYTLADGPWLYRFKCEPPKYEGTAYVEVKDDLSYRKMVDTFKKTFRKDSNNKYTISMIHSMDKYARDKWEEKERENKKAEEVFSEEFSGSGGQY